MFRQDCITLLPRLLVGLKRNEIWKEQKDLGVKQNCDRGRGEGGRCC